MSLSASPSWPVRGRGRTAQVRRGGGVVLTRRGRAVVSGLVGAVVVALAALLGLSMSAVAQAAHGGAPPAAVYRGMTRVLVRPGDTLWSIALRQQPAADPRIVVQQIIQENALAGTAIQPGQRLWVPAG